MKYKKKIILLLAIFLFLPLVLASPISINDTKISATGMNYTIQVDSMVLEELVIESNAIRIYNLSSSGTNFTNLNATYDAKIDFYWLTLNLSVYNVDTSTYLFNSTPGNQSWNVTFAPGEVLRIENITAPEVDTTPPTFDNLRNFSHTVDTAFSSAITATDETAIGTYWLNQTNYFTINSANGLITNSTNLSRIEIHYLTITVNDTSGNQVSGIFYINITEVSINLTIHNPTNTTYDKSDIDLLISTVGTIDNHWYSLDGEANISFIPNITIHNLGWESNHTLTVYINDSSNNVVSEMVTFYIGEYKNRWFYFYIVILGLAVLLFILGYSQETYLLTMLSGFLIMAFSITFIFQGYPGLDNYTMQISIILLTSAIGLYITANSALGIIREGL